MRELLLDWRRLSAEGHRMASCRLVETRGSTPQKPGAMMLVLADGSQAGTLGGGCVEAEVKRRALAAIHRGRVELAKFQLDDDYGWDDGLICGGRMQVLIDPLIDACAKQYFNTLAELLETGTGGTEAVILDGQRSGLPAGALFLLDDRCQLLAARRAERHDNRLPPKVLAAHVKPLADRPSPYTAEGIAFLPVLPRARLVIVGGGHVGKAVANLAADLDFDVWVVDDRHEYVSQERFPRVVRRIAGTIADVLPALEITPNTYCLIVTRGHQHDEEALYHLADRGAAYVGMIGSRRKIRLIFDDLTAQGVSAEALRKVHAPVGIDIGSRTVPEIAVSIAAELVAHRNRLGR
jgi:xanthine dehydrogenase accessory factor